MAGFAGAQLPSPSLLPTETPHKHFGSLNQDTSHKDASTGRCQGIAQEGKLSGRFSRVGWEEHSVLKSRHSGRWKGDAFL